MNEASPAQAEETKPIEPLAVIDGVSVWCAHTRIEPLASLKPHPRNTNTHPLRQLKVLGKVIREKGWRRSITVSLRSGFITKGHGATSSAMAEGIIFGPVDFQQYASEADEIADMIADNAIASYAQIDDAAQWAALEYLKEIDPNFDNEFAGLDLDSVNELSARLNGDGGNNGGMNQRNSSASLVEKFGVPPFSVLDARQGYWQDRKRAWLGLGLKSELGRAAYPGGAPMPAPGKPSMRGDGAGKPMQSTTVSQGWQKDGEEIMKRGPDAGGSIFDPVLCELAYRWFTRPGFAVLDCFAGGSVRGIVAARLGRNYIGVDLRAEQVEANRAQWEELRAIIGENTPPVWHQGDSVEIASVAPGEYDFFFSCPPYLDLEVYSDQPGDISNMKAPDFFDAYSKIITESVAMLKDNRFACFVVGDVRDDSGYYYNFVSRTIQAFLDAGMSLYNEAILVTAVGSLPLRIGRQFGKYRKLGKAHQNVLIFFKGDPKKILDLGDCEFGADLNVPAEPAAESSAAEIPAEPNPDEKYGEPLQPTA